MRQPRTLATFVCLSETYMQTTDAVRALGYSEPHLLQSVHVTDEQTGKSAVHGLTFPNHRTVSPQLSSDAEAFLTSCWFPSPFCAFAG